MRGLIDLFIWILIVFVPIVVLPVAVVWWLVRSLRGKGSLKAKKAPKEENPEEEKE